MSLTNPVRCPHCQQPMQVARQHLSGGTSYFCGCRPGGTWHNAVPIAPAPRKEPQQ